MKCPRDNTVLTVNYRHGIEIDTCTTCHGIWLDKDELDKIMAATKGSSTASKNDESRDSKTDLAIEGLHNVRPGSSSTSSAASDASPSTGGGSGIGDFFADLFGGL